jgi:hypothetical protein
MLRDSKPKNNVVEKRRVMVFPFTFKLRWMNIWCKIGSRKEVGFMRALWNKAITINTWKAKVDNSINQTCPLCVNEKKSTLHKFWECCHAQWAWEYTQVIVCELAYSYKPSWVVAPLHWKQSVLATKSPRQVQHVENIRSLLRGITLCTLCELNGMIWFSTMKDEMLLKFTKLFGMPYLIMVGQLGIDVWG